MQQKEGAVPMDVARADTVDAELDRLISKRASQDRRPDPDEEHDRWQGSVERYHQRRREEHRWEWIRHFDRMAAGHASISEDYRRRADELAWEPSRPYTPARERAQ